MKIKDAAVQIAIDGKPHTIELRRLKRSQARTLCRLVKQLMDLEVRAAVTDGELSDAEARDQDRAFDDAFAIIASRLPHAATRRISRSHRVMLVRAFIPRIVRAVGAR